MIVVIETILFCVFGFFFLYLSLLSVLALVARKRSAVKSSRPQRMAFIVPAHNEELAIEKTLRSLLRVDYPRDYFDVIVIADNCTDRTAEIARREGAIVYERWNVSLRGKGYALRWCFDRLLSEKALYEAIVVIDADSVVSSNFLDVMSSYLERGAKVIQSSDMVELQPGEWSPEVTRVGFTLYNYVRPLGRRVIGCSAGLRGNGMCITVDTLRQVPWQAYSLNEDLEYGLVLLLHGISVLFAPEATVYATMPKNPDNARTQRARWEAGRFPVIRNYTGSLIMAAFRHGSFRALDAFVDLVTPPLTNLVTFVTLLSFGSLFLHWVGIEGTARFVWLWLLLLGVAAVHVVVGLYAAGADRLMYKALLFLPRYGLWKLNVYSRLLQGKRTDKWIRTARESACEQLKAPETWKH
jgi:cellulose synthase/poly-beta-1,6-N-acetylglucosamine synthase-like glycosyltransferase